MRIFKDINGRDWSVSIDTFVVSRLRSELKVDLMEIFSTDLMTRLVTDIVLAAEVLFHVLKPQLDKASIDAEAWAQAIRGKYADVHTVLAEEIADFFSSQGARGVIVKGGLRTMGMAERMMAEKAEEWFEETRVNEKIRSEIQKIFGDSSGSVPES